MQIWEHLPRIWNHQNHSLYFMVRTRKCIYQNSGTSRSSAYCCLSLIKSYSTNILSLITEAGRRAANFLKESVVDSSCPSLLCHDPCALTETDSEGHEELSAPQSCLEGYFPPSFCNRSTFRSRRQDGLLELLVSIQLYATSILIFAECGWASKHHESTRILCSWYWQGRDDIQMRRFCADKSGRSRTDKLHESAALMCLLHGPIRSFTKHRFKDKIIKIASWWQEEEETILGIESFVIDCMHGTPRIPALPLPGTGHDIFMHGLSPWAMVVQHARQVLEVLWNPNLWTPWGLHALPSLKSKLERNKLEEQASSTGSWTEASWLWFPMNLNDMKYILLAKVGTVLGHQQAQTRALPWADTGLQINGAWRLFAVRTTCVRFSCPSPYSELPPTETRFTIWVGNESLRKSVSAKC